MKVLLVRPALPRRAIGAAHASLCEPLELEVLAGALRDHDVTVHDMRVDATPFDSVLSRIEPDVVGVTAGTVEVSTAWAVLRRVKEVFPAVATVVGGPHASARPEDFAGSFVNAVVLGRGAAAFKAVVEARETGRPLDDIPGLVVSHRGRQVKTAPRQPMSSLGEHPSPDRHTTAAYRSRYYHGWASPVTLVQGSAGATHAGTVGAPTLEPRIVQEVERVAAEMVEQEAAICMADDDALVEPARTARLCALLKEAGFQQSLYLCTRSEAVVDNAEIVEDLAEVGLSAVALALSGPGAGGPTETQRKAVDILHSNGVAVAGEFEARPDFDVGDFRRLGGYARELGVEFPVFSVPTPFPGTLLFFAHRDTLGTPDWELFDRVHCVLPIRLPLRRFYAELGRLYRGAYGLASIPRMSKAVPWLRLPGLSRQLTQFIDRVERAHLDQEAGLHVAR
jgi:methyltransferase